MPEPALSPAWLAWLAIPLLALLPLLSLLTALLERSGPIRMRHWIEESGGRLRAIYREPGRFDLFRYLLNLAAKVAPLALFLAIVAAVERLDVKSAAGVAFVVVIAAIGATELANRRLLRRDPESALRQMTWAYRGALALSMPLVLLVGTWLLPVRQDPKSDKNDDEASDEEIEAFIDVGTKEGILEPEERDLVWGVVDFADTQVRSVMTPRVDMVCASVASSFDEIADSFSRSGYSRLPIYRGSIEQILGVLHIRDVLGALRAEPRPPIEELLQTPMFVPETKPLDELLREFQKRRQQMAIVLDEYGGAAGIVTVEDLVEEIVGEIVDENDEGVPENTLLPDGSLVLDGRAHIDVVGEFFPSWTFEEAPVETVGGLLSSRFGYVPRAGEHLDHAGLRFEVELADDRRVLSVRVRPIAAVAR